MNDKSRKTGGYILICFLAISIGFIIAVQAKATTGGGDYKGGLVSIAQAQSVTAELAEVKKEKQAAQQELQVLEAKLKEIETAKADESSVVKSTLEELDKYRMVAGVVEVKGPGIIVNIDDPPADVELYSDSVIMYSYELLLGLVNKLKDAGAEAISINGQRITTFTEISLAGSNVNINSVPTAPPYEIRVIGNPDTLESTISIRYGIIYEMKNTYGLQVDVEQFDEIIIPRYSEVIKFRYAKDVE